jgi:hypothetical protein
MPRTPGSSGNGKRPAGARGSKARPAATGDGAQFTVRCPSCGTTYHVPITYAGKRAQCTHCGARATLPAPAPVKRAAARLAKSRAAAPDDADGAPVVRIGAIGRGHAGKTALFQALGDGLVGDYLPSGLHLDAADPREVARMIKEAEEAQRLLHRSGLPPTLEVSQTRYCIYQGDEQRVVCRMREVIGQVLTHTLPDSHPRLQAQYTNYLKSLVNAHVLWVVVPCPPADPGPRDRKRYSNDLRITLAYLREALRLRTLAPKAAVALVLSKTDALFPSAAAARAALTEDVLHKALGPLVQLIEQSDHVSDAAIIPVTAFGFGKAVLRDDGTNRAGTDPESCEEPFGDEPIWLLKDGESPDPYNLDTLFLWSLLMGLLNQGAAEKDPGLDAICRMLRDDLEAGDPWLVPVKGGVSLTTA